MAISGPNARSVTPPVTPSPSQAPAAVAPTNTDPSLGFLLSAVGVAALGGYLGQKVWNRSHPPSDFTPKAAVPPRPLALAEPLRDEDVPQKKGRHGLKLGPVVRKAVALGWQASVKLANPTSVSLERASVQLHESAQALTVAAQGLASLSTQNEIHAKWSGTYTRLQQLSPALEAFLQKFPIRTAPANVQAIPLGVSAEAAFEQSLEGLCKAFQQVIAALPEEDSRLEQAKIGLACFEHLKAISTHPSTPPVQEADADAEDLKAKTQEALIQQHIQGALLGVPFRAPQGTDPQELAKGYDKYLQDLQHEDSARPQNLDQVREQLRRDILALRPIFADAVAPLVKAYQKLGGTDPLTAKHAGESLDGKRSFPDRVDRAVSVLSEIKPTTPKKSDARRQINDALGILRSLSKNLETARTTLVQSPA